MQVTVQTIDQIPAKSGAKTPRTPKALRAKCSTQRILFREALGVRTRPRVAFELGHVLSKVKRGD